MSLFDWFRKEKEPKATKKYVFSDEDREYSHEINQKKKEIKMLMLEREAELHRLKIEKQKLELQQELEELKGVYDDVEEASEDNDIMKMITALAPLLLKNQNQTVAPVVSPPNNSETSSPQPVQAQQLDLSDEQLNQIWKNTPFAAKMMAKKMDDKTLEMYIKQQMPNVSTDTIARALKIIKT